MHNDLHKQANEMEFASMVMHDSLMIQRKQRTLSFEEFEVLDGSGYICDHCWSARLNWL